MDLKEFSRNQFKVYVQAEGSEYIASEFALYQIVRLFNKFCFKNVLEVGVGIGTVSGSLIKFADERNKSARFFGTEENSFCLGQIPINLGADSNKIKLFPNIKSLPLELFDFIIIDGKEQNLELIKEKTTKNAVIAIEGDRNDQLSIIKTTFPNTKYVHLISIAKNSIYSDRNTEHFEGGLRVVFINPNFLQYSFWVKEKILYHIKLRLRKFL